MSEKKILDSNGKINNNTIKVEDLEKGKCSELQYSVTNKRKSTLFKKFICRFMIIMFLLSLLGGLAGVIAYFVGWQSVVQLFLVAFVAYLFASGGYRWFYVAACTAKRDLTALIRFILVTLRNKKYLKNDTSLVDVFRSNVAKHPNRVAYIFETQEWTFQQVEEYSNKVANVFRSHGFKKGDTVALFLENRPEYICLWLGLAKLGCIIPLINTNLKDQSLLHSFKTAGAQAIIYGSELISALSEITEGLNNTISLYKWSENKNGENVSLPNEKNLTQLISSASSDPPVLNYRLGYHDKLVYIYTSGTTGLPKAAVITGARFMFLTTAIHQLSGFRASDRYYTPLPLYHTAGGVMTVGQALIYGSSVVIRKKFSASSYFADCSKYGCTVAQYIGEMCRYVLSTPPRPEDKQHKIRLIFGNGLRPQIWKEFVDRFQIPRVAEFYGATEGNANIVNVDNTFGAIGFVSRIIPSVYPISIIKADPATGEPIRNAKGLCEPCPPNEPGVFIGKIIPNNPSRQFLGYVDEKASEKKVVKDVFRKGDSAFISGDLLVSDEFGYLYFKDRTGDTFRWKGENVSTTEVEAVISNIIDYKDCVVYGVEMRGQEGRAGMAAILDEANTLDLTTLANGVKNKLPTYARPQFIRQLSKLPMTGTYKLKKVDLQNEGFEPAGITDRLYYFSSNGSYELLTQEIYEQIQQGKIRF